MRPGLRTVRVFECTEPGAVERAYEVGRDIGLQLGAEQERAVWEARVQALRELAEQATAGATDVASDAEEPVELSQAERDTFAEIAFTERVAELLDDDSDE